MTSGGDDNRGVDGVGVHAALVVVVHRHQGPVGNDTGNTDPRTTFIRARDQVLHRSCVEHLDIIHGQHLGQDGARKQRGVLDHHVIALVVEGHADLAQEHVGRLAHHHGAEQLPAQPGAAAGRNAGLDEGDAEVGAEGAQRVSRR